MKSGDFRVPTARSRRSGDGDIPPIFRPISATSTFGLSVELSAVGFDRLAVT